MTDNPSRGPSPLGQDDELAAELTGDGAPLLIDVRPADRYAGGALPGAVHLDLWGLCLIDTSEAPLRAFMWMIGHLFSLRGVSPDRPVVVYEEDSGVRAARGFWFLEYLGHPDASVLDGGVRAWRRAGRSLSTEPAAPVPGTWHGTPTAARLATWQDTLAALGRDEVCVLDTRSADEYYGRLIRARRGGAIPGAVHLEWTKNLEDDGRFRPPADLRRMYEQLGVTPGREVITYCQGGYRAAHGYLALRVLGYPQLRNYTGSWKEWGDREDLPIEHPTPPAGRA
jgi:thiosulfate/3-mercaptopyruvate sulfurtransferase